MAATCDVPLCQRSTCAPHDPVHLPDRRYHELSAPLHVASQKGHPDVVRCLVEAGVDLNQGNYEGGTSLALARHRGHKKVVAYLEGAGATA